MKKAKPENWIKVNILKSQSKEIAKILKNGEFANMSQFVVFTVRKELDLRKRIQSGIKNKAVDEKEIKEKLESWIEEINKKAILEEKLKKAFENSKSHTKTLSMLT
ncbi:hypothetical protein [Nitrosopumilus ureiphilus]|uniref:Uncharacterized protein n=1 Tax=Nitrosopumilus ureiphilus TaxID=1470067 RepID=A0A7D5M5P6_9ARCH|nr:hypothetical protein [Nitrosopumilus ureiphilus]QLH07153.1 hypothetical protein C5F50_08745 [Nitrosopumilus ureiphilus]